MHLSEDVEKTALTLGDGAKQYLTDRISYYFDRLLGRTSQFWFVLEESNFPRPHLHLHGAIACSGHELKKVRKALRAAGGKWEASGVRFQVETKLEPDNGWVSYAFKNPYYLGERVLKLSGNSSWRDDPFRITEDLKPGAMDLYKSVRKSVPLSKQGLRKARH